MLKIGSRTNILNKYLFRLLGEQHGRLAATAEHGSVSQVVPLEPALQRDGLLGGDKSSLNVP